MKCVSWFVITRNIIIRVAPRRKVWCEEKERISLESPVKKLLHDWWRLSAKTEAVSSAEEQGRCKNVKFGGFDRNTL